MMFNYINLVYIVISQYTHFYFKQCILNHQLNQLIRQIFANFMDLFIHFQKFFIKVLF